MGSNVLENKPSELFPRSAAIDVNLGSAISHDIMAEAAYFFSETSHHCCWLSHICITFKSAAAPVAMRVWRLPRFPPGRT